MEIYQTGEAFAPKDGDIEFAFTKLILRDQDGALYAATTTQREHLSPTLDLTKLEKTLIPKDSFRLPFLPHLSRAPEPLPSKYYVKEPSLLDYGDSPASLNLGQSILHEANVLEIIGKHPHPNIVSYHGCVVDAENRIRGLCFDKYKITLSDRLRSKDPIDGESILLGIEAGIRHLHSLGFVHNDINPRNVMLNESDSPVLIDFDSCQREGEKLGLKAGTMGWQIEGAENATFENDLFGLAKIREQVDKALRRT